MRNITKQAIEAFMAYKPFCQGNTAVAQIEDVSHLILHGSRIASINHATNELLVTTALWNTVTTRERLNGIPGVSVTVKAGQLYLNGIAWSGDWKTVKGEKENVTSPEVAGPIAVINNRAHLNPAQMTQLISKRLKGEKENDKAGKTRRH